MILIKLHNSIWNVLMPNIALGYCERNVECEQMGEMMIFSDVVWTCANRSKTHKQYIQHMNS